MQMTSAESHEVARVAAHIEGAEQLARRAPPRRLGRLRQLVRTLLLQELESYRRDGVFPKNRDFPDRPMPYFVDADGTRCAMAHLLELGGASALVAKIASERNNAFVHELADEPELIAWLDAAGLTVEEAARIQPAYCGPRTRIVCGGPSPNESVRPNARGVLEIRVTGAADGDGWAAARVENVFGDGGRFVVGAEVRYRGRSVGTLFVVPVYGTEDAAIDGSADAPVELSGGVPLGPDGIIRLGPLGSNDDHPLTAQQIADAYRSPDCAATLRALDAWWSVNTCGPRSDGASTEQNGGASPASTSRVTSTSPSADDGGGCSTAGTDASAATLQVLLALVGAISARRLARAARRG